MAAFIKFDGIDGETTDKDHKSWTDLAAFSQLITKPGQGTGATRRRGDVVLEDLHCTKELDKSSPKIAEAVCKGKVFPKVELHLTASYTDSCRVTYYAYDLKNVQVVLLYGPPHIIFHNSEPPPYPWKEVPLRQAVYFFLIEFLYMQACIREIESLYQLHERQLFGFGLEQLCVEILPVSFGKLMFAYESFYINLQHLFLISFLLHHPTVCSLLQGVLLRVLLEHF